MNIEHIPKIIEALDNAKLTTKFCFLVMSIAAIAIVRKEF